MHLCGRKVAPAHPCSPNWTPTSKGLPQVAPPHFPPRPPTQRELRRALKDLKVLVLANPLDLDARIRIARILRLLQKPAESVEHYRSVARYLAQGGYAHLAIGVARELLQVQPDHNDSLLLLAKLYAQTRMGGDMGMIARPREDESHFNAGLLPQWPATHTGVWRAIQPDQSHNLMMAMAHPRTVKDADAASGTFSALLQEGMDEVEHSGPRMNLSDADVVSEEAAADDEGVLDTSDVGALALQDGDSDAEVVTDDVVEEDHVIEEVDASDVVVTEDAGGTDPYDVDTALNRRPQRPVRSPDDNSDDSHLPPLPTAVSNLPEIPLFAGLGEGGKRTLSQAMVRRTAAAGTTVWEEGDDAFFLVIVAEGTALAERNSAAGSPVELARLGPGDVAGVFALARDRRRLATLRAVTDLEYLELRRAVVEKLAREHPPLGEALRDFFRERVVHNALSLMPVFKDMDPPTRADVAGRFRAKRYLDEDELFHEHAELCGLWVILEGVVQVGHEDEDGDLRTTAKLEAGSFLGTVAALRNESVSLSAVAVGSVTTVTLSHRALVELSQTHPLLLDMMDHLMDPQWRLAANVFGGSAQLPEDLAPPLVSSDG